MFSYMYFAEDDAGLMRYVSEFTTGETNVPRRVTLTKSAGKARFKRFVLERLC